MRSQNRKLLPVLTVASDDSQLVCPGHGHVGVPDHHDCIQTLGQGELSRHTIRDSCVASTTCEIFRK